MIFYTSRCRVSRVWHCRVAGSYPTSGVAETLLDTGETSRDSLRRYTDNFNPGVVGSENPTGPSALLPYLMQVGQPRRFLESRIPGQGILSSNRMGEHRLLARHDAVVDLLGVLHVAHVIVL